MKILTPIVMLALSGASALAISLPVAEDTFTTSRGVLTAANGRGVMLTLNTNQAALLKFDLSSLPAEFNPTNIVSARLKMFIVSTRKPGDLVATPITSPWTETVVTNTRMPSFDATIIGAVPAVKVLTKRFVGMDVTAAVIAALNGSGPDFGFLLRDTSGQTYIASKEGPGLGPSAQLEIDANLALNAAGGTAIPGSLVVGGNFDLFGLSRQGSETGISQGAGRGIITRRLESTNAAAGCVVARTDTLTLERDGTPGGWRIVNTANPGDTIVVAIGVQDQGGVVANDFVLASDSPAGTNTVLPNNPYVLYFRCSFGNTVDVRHQTEVSLTRSPDGGGTNWIGSIISSYNQ